MSLRAWLGGSTVAVFLAFPAMSAENLIANIISEPDQTIKGEWIIQTEKILPQKNIELLDMEENPIRDSPCVKINLIREEKSSLWIQQVTVEPIKNSDLCIKEASTLLRK